MYQIELADGEEANGLAGLLNMLISQNLANNPEKEKIAQKMNCSIGIYSVDTDQKCTAIFRPDKLIIKNGYVEPMRLVVTASTNQILGVSQLKITKNLIPTGFFTKQGGQLIKDILAGRLKIKGLINHLPTVLRFIALASVV